MDKLLLDIKASSLNSFRVMDVSCYGNKALVKSGVLEIMTPSSVSPVLFPVDPEFDVIHNAVTLKLSSSFKVLPDGAYSIIYSVAPNAKVKVQYYYYRVNTLRSEFNKESKKLFKDKCTLSSKDYQKKIDALTEIEQYINVAVVAAEDFHDIPLANNFYSEASDLLKKYQCKKS